MNREELISLLSRIERMPSEEDMTVLYDMIKSMEIRDYQDIEQVVISVMASLEVCWNQRHSQIEELALNSWEILQKFPETNTSSAISTIVNSISKEFCLKLLKSFDRGQKEASVTTGNVLMWVYRHRIDLRGSIRLMVGSKLVRYSASPDLLKSVDIRPHLKLVAKIVAGMTDQSIANARTTQYRPDCHRVQWDLLVKVLLPLHTPNGMIEWRDQLPVVQPYHEALVLCLVRLAEWERMHGGVKHMQEPNTMLAHTIRVLVTSLWPEGFNSNTPKEVLFVHELEKLLGMSSDVEFDAVFPYVMSRLKSLLSHDNMIPLQRTLQMFRNKIFIDHISRHAFEAISGFLPPLYRGGKLFWNQTVNKMTAIVLKKLKEMDDDAFCAAAEHLIGKTPSVTAPSEKKSNPSLPPSSIRSVRAHKRPPSEVTPERDTISGQKTESSSSCSERPPGKFSPMSTFPRSKLNPNTIKQAHPGPIKPGENPPVTITGVAPWAFKHQKEPTGTSSIGDVKSMESAKNEVISAANVVMEYIERCRLNGGGGDEEDGHGPFWVREQAASKPSLLPDLKFHDLVFGQQLGEGSFGTVKYCRRILKGPNASRSQWPEYAVKRMVQIGRSCIDIACREIAALHELSHPGIARLISAFRYTDGYYLVLEYAANGDLHTHILKNGPLDELCSRFIIGEICAALLSIHDLGLSFNDLKPENILITSLGHVKLTDFGACRAVTSDGHALLLKGNELIKNIRDGDWRDNSEIRNDLTIDDIANSNSSNDSSSVDAEGTPGYLPPEVLISGSIPGLAGDSWALGCVLYFCLVGKPKYYGTTFHQVLVQVCVDYPELSESLDSSGSKSKEVKFDATVGCPDMDDSSIPESPKNLIDMLLQLEPSRRYSVREATQHPFITGLDCGNADHTIDVLSLHAGDAIPLPVASEDKAGDSIEDKEWARRQCSIAWAPMPADYQFSGTSTSGSKGKLSLTSSNCSDDILETENENNCGFTPM